VPNPDDPFAIDSDDEEDLTTVDVPGTGSVGRYYVRKKAEAKVKVVQLPVIDAKKYRRDSTSSQSDNVVLDDSGNEDGLEAKELQRHKGPVTTPFKVTLAMLNSIAPPVETRLVTTHNIDDDMKDFDAVEIEEIENSEEDLLREVRETLQRAHENNLELDGIILDMTNIKLSAEATLTDYAMATFLGLLSLVGVTEESKSGKVTATVVAALQTSLEKWLLVLSKFTRDLDDQMCVVMGLEAACMYHPNFNAFFQFLLQQSYDLEILPEEAVLAWEKLRVSQAQEANLPTPDMVTRAQVFLSWLKESDEDSEEESESD
jgi:hypothetical protein